LKKIADFFPTENWSESPKLFIIYNIGPRSPLAPKLSAPNADGYKVVCYYTNWSQYRQKIGKFLPENIDPFLCTHIIFAFGWIKNGKLTSFESNDLAADGKQESILQSSVSAENFSDLIFILEFRTNVHPKTADKYE
jgi:GH18 family chitinase